MLYQAVLKYKTLLLNGYGLQLRRFLKFTLFLTFLIQTKLGKKVIFDDTKVFILTTRFLRFYCSRFYHGYKSVLVYLL